MYRVDTANQKRLSLLEIKTARIIEMYKSILKNRDVKKIKCILYRGKQNPDGGATLVARKQGIPSMVGDSLVFDFGEREILKPRFFYAIDILAYVMTESGSKWV